MGAEISSLLFQPLLLGTAAAIMIIGLINAKKEVSCKSCDDNGKPTKTRWGSEVFQQDMAIGAAIIIIAVVVQFFEGFQI